MATQWIVLSKIIGPLVNEIRKDLEEWSSLKKPFPFNRPSNHFYFEVDDTKSMQKMRNLRDLLEQNAHRPPIVYYEKRIDPWTAGPLFLAYNLFMGGPFEMRLVISTELSYLFIQPNAWNHILREFDNIRARRKFAETEIELELLLNHIGECASSWESLLTQHEIERAILISSQSLDIGWLDEEVVDSRLGLPGWYSKPICS